MPPAIQLTMMTAILSGFIPAFIAKKKGRNFWGYYFLSMIITPLISTIIALSVKSRYRTAPAQDFQQPFQEQQEEAQLELQKEIQEPNPYQYNPYDTPVKSKNAIIDSKSKDTVAGNGDPICKNCGEPMNGSGKYCSKCGSDMFKL